MEKISFPISILIILTTLFAIGQFFKASGKSRIVLYVIFAWMFLVSIMALTGFYKDAEAFPPRFIFLIGPPILFIIILFTTRWGRRFIGSLDNSQLTLLHILRIPVEITLYYLFVAKLIPQLMTFEGRNYDILSGLSAGVIFYLVFIAKKAGRNTLLVWNFICLGLLLNVLIIAIFSARTPFQKLAFDQPNIGVTYFPFIWLPAIIVPIVLLSHLASIRQLIKTAKKSESQKQFLVSH